MGSRYTNVIEGGMTERGTVTPHFRGVLQILQYNRPLYLCSAVASGSVMVMAMYAPALIRTAVSSPK